MMTKILKIFLPSDATSSIDLFHSENLREDIENDLDKLNKIFSKLENIKIENDPKLKKLIENLEYIIEEAEEESSNREDFLIKKGPYFFIFLRYSVVDTSFFEK